MHDGQTYSKLRLLTEKLLDFDEEIFKQKYLKLFHFQRSTT